MTNLLQDLRYGLRSLVKAPAFATAAIAALALGIGATTAIFSVVNAVVLEPLPYADPDRLVSLWEVNHEKNLDHEPLSPVNFMDYRGLSQVFADAAAWWRPEVTLRDPDMEPVRVNTIEVSGNFLTVLGVQPALGAGFPADVFFSRDRLVIMSDRLWRSRYSADPERREGHQHERQPVHRGRCAASRVRLPRRYDLWQLLNWDLTLHSRGAHFMEAVARMKPGTRVVDAQRELDALTGRLSAEFTGTNRGGARADSTSR